MTAIDGNFVRFSCFFENRNFPTINGVDIFDKIECTESGWSLPDDMKPIWCEHVSCPPLLDAGEEVRVECKERDAACKAKKPYTEDVNDERYQDCQCSSAIYQCKKESSNIAWPIIYSRF